MPIEWLSQCKNEGMQSRFDARDEIKTAHEESILVSESDPESSPSQRKIFMKALRRSKK